MCWYSFEYQRLKLLSFELSYLLSFTKASVIKRIRYSRIRCYQLWYLLFEFLSDCKWKRKIPTWVVNSQGWNSKESVRVCTIWGLCELIRYHTLKLTKFGKTVAIYLIFTVSVIAWLSPVLILKCLVYSIKERNAYSWLLLSKFQKIDTL